MTLWQDGEQLVPLVKPLFDGLRSVRDFFGPRKQEHKEHSIDIPKKTLILLPDVQPFPLIWAGAKWNDKDGMQISGRLQATNTSKYNIRASGIRLLQPANVEVVNQMVLVRTPESHGSSQKHLIPAQSIGELSFMFIVMPVTGEPAQPLKVAISILDQFGNEHVVRNLECKFMR
jgi:hypothetical protein